LNRDRSRQALECLIAAVFGVLAPIVLLYAHRYFGGQLAYPPNWWGGGHNAAEIASAVQIHSTFSSLLEYVWGASIPLLLYKPSFRFFRQTPAAAWPIVIFCFMISLSLWYRTPEVFSIILRTPILLSFVLVLVVNALMARRTNSA
jgi:hypothetical protein